jgi:hypothetical protein
VENPQLQSSADPTIFAFASAERKINIFCNDLNWFDSKFQIISVNGGEIISYEGMLGFGTNQSFTVPSTGAYYIVVTTGGKRYFFKRIL